MDLKTLAFHVRGVVPTIMHNGQLADPMNEFAIAMKEITSNRTKTETEFVKMAKIEHEGSLYLNGDGKPFWPTGNIKAMLVDAAKKSKNGKNAKAGIVVMGDTSLIYDGPKTAEGLWKDKRFVSRMGVRIEKNRVQRTRPIFPEWELRFEVGYLADVCSKAHVSNWVQIAGRLIGLSDYRPDYGRFVVLSEEEL